jgi:hypothetical protein
VLDDERYEVIADRLRRAEFNSDTNNRDRQTRQRWCVDLNLDAPSQWTFSLLRSQVRRRDHRSRSRSDLAATVTPRIKLAFRRRGERKDAYDLYYVFRHYVGNLTDVADRLRPLLGSSVAQQALLFSRKDFERVDAIGPRRIAEFLQAADPDDVQADASEVAMGLLDRSGLTECSHAE